MDAMLAKASTPLYESFTTNILSTILFLLNLRIVHGVNNVFMNELFSLLHLELPKVNQNVRHYLWSPKVSQNTRFKLWFHSCMHLQYKISVHCSIFLYHLVFSFFVNYVSYFIYYFHQWFKQFKHKSHGTQII